jgi:hypothetical protein
MKNLLLLIYTLIRRIPNQIRDWQAQEAALHAPNLPTIAAFCDSAREFAQFVRRIGPQAGNDSIKKQDERHYRYEPSPHQPRERSWLQKGHDDDVRNQNERQQQQRQRPPSWNLKYADAPPISHRVAKNFARLRRRKMVE